MYLDDYTKKEIKKIDFTKEESRAIRKKIKNNFAQKSSSNDRMLDLDCEVITSGLKCKISTFGDEFEKRNQFARDRDRIIYSNAFRRLEHKAQVYSHEKGDHYRTRLTHTLEVMQIARGIARNLGLNEDLTEAIALGHDIGHTPFGHAGEEILDQIMRGEDDLGGKLKYKMNYGGFKHNFHSLKILDVIERKYEDKIGLNLTWQVLDGILKHTKIKKRDKSTNKEKKWDLSRFVKNDRFFKPLVPDDIFFINPINKMDFEGYEILESTMLNLKSINLEHSLTLEGQVVDIADEIAQRQHDLDDGLRDIELRMDELDILIDTEKIIDKVIEEMILEKIGYDTIIKSKFCPSTFLLDEDYDDLKLLLVLKDLIHKSEVEEDIFKWKNRIRNVVSYFIHDVTQNTIKNINNKQCVFHKNNLLHREENLDYLISKKNFTHSSALLNYKRFWNRRNYAMSQCVIFSSTAEKFNKKIEQYIDKRIINSYNVNRFDGKAKFIIRQLFKAYYENPKQMNKTQLNYLSSLINYNMDNYYELNFSDGTRVRDIQFDSNDPEFILNLKDVSRLIKLLKLEFLLEDLNGPGINLDLAFLNEINGSMVKVSQKWGYLDNEEFELVILEDIFKKVNEMDRKSIMKEENKEICDKLLFIKCLIENHYSYLSVICDYIAGMTDNYAKSEYKKLYLV